jgi:murein DD-endopeptidase MepM/ murein hydrolase activator NlpD
MCPSAGRHRASEFGAVAILAALHLALYLALRARLGVTGVWLWYVGPPLLAALAAVALFGTFLAATRHRLTSRPDRVARLALLAALAGAPALYRTYPSSHDGHPSRVRFVLPLNGPVTVAWGAGDSHDNAHGIAPDQRWGYDLVVTSGGSSFQGSGQRLADYHAYGRQVVAPAAGAVHAVHDGEPDIPIGRKGKGDDLGNHVVLHVAPAEFLFVAHLQPGSIAVKPGDQIAAGQNLGRVGNSGFSSEPHVHLHLQDTARRHLAESIPFSFVDYCTANAYVAAGMPAGGRAHDRWAGQIVSRAGVGACDP